MAETMLEVTPEMTPAEMREYYLEQTRRSLAQWEANNFSIHDNPPFPLDSDAAAEVRLTPELAQRINLREQIEAFAEEAKVSTAGVRENQNVLCPWDHRYRINEYIFALIAEALSKLVVELQPERFADGHQVDLIKVRKHLSEQVGVIEAIFGRPLEEVVELMKFTPVRIVGGEVRSNTPRYVDLMSRIYAANGLPVVLTEDPKCGDTSNIFMWSFLTFVLGLSGGDYFTSSHGAPQKQSDKILAPDGAQYLPPLYARIVDHLLQILEQIEAGGYTLKLAARKDPKLIHRLSYSRMATLYASYLKKGPAGSAALELIHKAVAQGLRLKLDFFGGSGYKTIDSIFKALGIEKVFEGGYLRTEEDPFFHNIGFRVAKKKTGDGYEVVHDSVDASIPTVVKSAGYDQLLSNDSNGQMVFNVDPDADRFVVGQVVAKSEQAELERLGISFLELTPDKLFAIYSPNQFFLMLAENDRVVAVRDGSWDKCSNFNIHTYVSALAWDEWAAHHNIPVVRVPVGFKEIAAIERQVEEALAVSKGQDVVVSTELGERITLGKNPKLHHAGEESGGKIGGPKEPIFNVLGRSVIAMREKSSGEACVSAVSLAARLFTEGGNKLEATYLHHYLAEIFTSANIANPMEYRGDIVHYNEAIFDPEELAKAKKEGIAERVVFNQYFTDLAEAVRDGKMTLEAVQDKLSAAMPAMASDWRRLEKIDVWSDGLQCWFAGEGKVRDLCIRPSGTDAKTKIYLDGKDKQYLIDLFEQNFKDFRP